MSSSLLESTQTYPLLNAIQNNKTVLLYKFSQLNPEYLDINVILPTLEESKFFITFAANNPNLEYDIEVTISETYIPSVLHRSWLNNNAPAGLLTSIVKSLLYLGFPNNPDSINTILNISRAQQTIYDQFKSQMLVAGVTIKEVTNIDVYKLFEIAVKAEAVLKLDGRMEQGFEALNTSENNKTVRKYSPSVDAPVTGSQSSSSQIPQTDEEMERFNRQLAREGVLAEE